MRPNKPHGLGGFVGLTLFVKLFGMRRFARPRTPPSSGAQLVVTPKEGGGISVSTERGGLNGFCRSHEAIGRLG